MLKRKDKIGLLLVVGLIAVLALSACGGSKSKATATPTVEPTKEATATSTATAAPTEKPTEMPTEVPTEIPTEQPTEVSMAPTNTLVPTAVPTEKPTQKPTEKPTVAPTEVPTEVPTAVPTEKPTQKPTEKPTVAPTEVPTEVPTAVPTEKPTQKPTEKPTVAPTATEKPAEVAAAPTEAPTAEATPEFVVKDLIDCSKYDLSDLKIGLVTDVGQINDKSFNQSSWEGVLSAEKCGAKVRYIQTMNPTDYANNIAEFAEGGYNIIVTVGYALGPATLDAAKLYPDVTFIGVDQFQADTVSNVVGLVFHEDQSGFLAGVLAARLTKTNVIAAVLGTDLVPPVVAFKEGYEAGAKYVNPDINVISTYHPGGLDVAFIDPEWGAATAKQALDQNADVVFGAGGKTGNGALIEVANHVGTSGPPPFCIGVDTDQWLTVPEAHPCLVSSAMKLLDVGVTDIIKAYADQKVEPGNYYGQAGLAPFHDLEKDVPAEVQTELQTVAAGLADGSITTGYGVAPAEETTPEPTEAAKATSEAATATAAPSTSSLGLVKVGINAEYPPFEYVDESGNIVGFDPDLMNAIAQRAGFELQFINTRWDGIFVALESGEFDAVASAATITEEREKIVNFSNPYFNAGQMIAVLKANANTITTPQDLAGRRVGVQTGTTGDILASSLPGVEVVRYDEITLAFQALAQGKVDAVLNDGPTSADIIGKNPQLGAVLVGQPLSDEYYGIAVQPNEPQLLDAINSALTEIIADGTYEQIYVKWFGTEPPAQFLPPSK
jgi:basic membrane protein A